MQFSQSKPLQTPSNPTTASSSSFTKNKRVQSHQRFFVTSINSVRKGTPKTMVKSEKEIKSMTKAQLKQWLTKHDQRLPVDDRLKRYYYERAMSYLKVLHKEQSSINSKPSTRSKKRIVSNARTKKKASNNASSSSTPKSLKKKRPIVRTQRRQSSYDHSASPSLSRSKKKTIRVVRKSPSKQSPSLSKSLRKKRDRVRRATADPANLKKQIEQHNDTESENSQFDEDDDSVHIAQHSDHENVGDYKNKHIVRKKQRRKSNINFNERKFVCDQKPETMTITNLKKWLDKNNIDYAAHERKAVYVALVKRYCISSDYDHNSQKKRMLSPQHKKDNSPTFKKPKSSNSIFDSPIRKAPLPRSIRKSPLTPQDDEKSNGRKTRSKTGTLLTTPVLNKTGILKIDTPSKLAMRDEIRKLIFSGDDEDPLYAVDHKDKVTPGGGDGITPGGPLDADVMADCLSDLRKQQNSSPPVAVFHGRKRKASMDPIDRDLNDKGYIGSDMDSKEDKPQSSKSAPATGFFNSIIAKFSPHKPSSTESKAMELRRGMQTTNKKRKKVAASPYKAKRTVPSPEHNNGNFDNDVMESPMDHLQQYQQQPQAQSNPTPNHSGFYEDEPMSPAIASKQPTTRKSKRLQQQKHRSPPKQQPIKQQQHVPYRRVPESPGVSPSIPGYKNMQRPNKKKLSPMKLPFEVTLSKQQKSSKCKKLLSALSMFFVTFSVITFFVAFDGMDKVYSSLDELNEFFETYGVEEKISFCDSGSNSIGDSDVECQPCPQLAIVCRNGGARCKTNYVLQDDKCVLDGVIVKFAYDLHKQVKHLLSVRRGKYECGEMDDDNEGYGMKRDELISNVKVLDESKKHEAFDYFDLHIVPESIIVSKNEMNTYFSSKSIKSPQCKILECAKQNILGIISAVCVVSILIAIGCRRKSKAAEKKAVDAMISSVYNILEEYRYNNKQRHVPIDVIKQRVMKSSKNQKLWKKVDAVIQSDSNIQRSIRMVDGMQKKCLSLTAIQSLNNSNNQSGFSNPSWQNSPHGQQRQQQSWNFNNRSEQNEGFDFRGGNNQNDVSEQTRFPAHSKKNMWR